ncbi:MAG TPA: terminase family protein, partial [Armatimonadota bacterium]|nr:terminase family protein [Armatimonadota bacterium]
MDKMTGPKARLDLALRLFGWEPHPTQRLWMLADNRVKVAACGRRWGKTEAAAVDVATYAIAVQGSVQMIVSPTYDQSRLIYDHIERMMTNQITTNREAKITKTPYPKILIGSSMIMARTADEDGRNLRGHSADRVIVDEAAYVRDAVVEEVISPMLADKNGQLVMISTPFGKNHFYRAFMQGAELQTVLPESTEQTGSREAECARDAGEN